MGIATVALASLATLAAFVSLILSFVHFVTRQRPFLSVVHVTSGNTEAFLYIRVEVKNVGEVPAKTAVLKADFEGSQRDITGIEHPPRSLGAIFPDETVFGEFPMGRDFASYMVGASDIGGLNFDIDITYESPFSLQLWFINYGHHHTHQSLYLDGKNNWGRTGATQME